MSAASVSLPRETERLVGQDTAEARLVESWSSGRMPHAWLLTGPRGVGKATLAYRLARFVLTASRAPETAPDRSGTAENVTPTLDIPSGSSAGHLVRKGSHPDLIIVERTVNDRTGKLHRDIVVGDIATLSHRLRLTSSAGGWQVAIIDSADDMNRNAANALLKILEEPPKRTLLLLVSHAPGGLVPTIRSRCRTLNLPPLSDADVGTLLDRLCPGIEADRRDRTTSLAEGSIGRAIEIAGSQGLEALADALLLLDGTPPIDRLQLGDIAEKWARLGRGGEADPLGDRLEQVLWWLGRCVRRAAAGTAQADEAIIGENRAVSGLIARFGFAGCCERIDKARNQLRRGIDLNLDRKQIVSSVMMAIAD